MILSNYAVYVVLGYVYITARNDHDLTYGKAGSWTLCPNIQSGTLNGRWTYFVRIAPEQSLSWLLFYKDLEHWRQLIRM